jgi:ribosomal protein S8
MIYSKKNNKAITQNSSTSSTTLSTTPSTTTTNTTPSTTTTNTTPSTTTTNTTPSTTTTNTISLQPAESIPSTTNTISPEPAESISINPLLKPRRPSTTNDSENDFFMYISIFDKLDNNVTYNNGDIIGSNSVLNTPVSLWDKTKGIFTIPVDGIYLINASFFINSKKGGTRIGLMINDKLRYVIIEGLEIKTETLRTYSRVEQLNKNDKVCFKVTSGDGFTVYFGSEWASHTNITITKLTTSNYYNMIDKLDNNITYNNGDIIGSNSVLISTASEWDSNKGIFTVSNDGIYLINASFFINSKKGVTRIGLMINDKLRYVIIEGSNINTETLRTYLRVEQLNKNDKVSFKVMVGDGFTVYFGSELGSHTNITLTKLKNINNFNNLMDSINNNITYNSGDIIASNSSLLSISPEWDKNKGIFTISSDGTYLINASFFINGKKGGTRIGLMINDKLRYVIIEGLEINTETLRTYSTVESLKKNDKISFVVTYGNGFTVYFGTEWGSHTNITITKLNYF